MSELPGVSLRERLATVLSTDRVRLLRRIGELGEARAATDARVLAEIERSAQARLKRERELPVPTFPPELPVSQRRDEIARAIRDHQVVVLCGQTGSGKTTQLPKICLSLKRGGAGLIGHTQPRRLAARAVASRVAQELGGELGGVVGCAVRFSDQTSAQTRVKLMTDGILLAETSSDPVLSAYDTIIIDEAHERSLNIDFLLGYLRRLLPQRPDLKLIITSATIDHERFSAFFGGPSVAPVIEVSGRMFPVEHRYRPAEEPCPPGMRPVADAVMEALDPALPRGDVLVFLPGEREIRQAAEALKRERVDAEVLPLFARLSAQEQDRIFRPAAGGRSRVVLATNVAETSLTVPGIRYVVDTGVARISRYDPRGKVQRLLVEPVSRASAEQRSGRCGRVSEGVCIRLFSQRDFDERPRFTDPEIRRSNLASVILRLIEMGIDDVTTFPLVDPPEAGSIKDGYETLFELGAIDKPEPGCVITQIGRTLSRLPVEPRVGRMIIAGQAEGCVREMIVLAAALSIQDPRERPMERAEAADRAHAVFRHPTSDFLTLLALWDAARHAEESLGAGGMFGWCREHFLSPTRIREWADAVWQLAELCEEMDITGEAFGKADERSVHRALLTGLIANLLCRDDNFSSHEYNGAHSRGVSVFPGSSLFKKGPKWMLAGEIVQTTRVYARCNAKIEDEWIEELADHMLERRVTDEHYDTQAGESVAFKRVTMRGLVVVPRRRVALAKSDSKRARALFLERGLAAGAGLGEHAFAAAVREVSEQAQGMRARLRQTDVLRPAPELAAWFDERLPATVVDRASLEAWASSVARDQWPIPRVRDVLKSGVADALDGTRFPNSLTLSDGDRVIEAPLEYRLTPGRDDDGVSVTLGLQDLELLTPEQAAWLVPGMLSEIVATLVKQLPKQVRAILEGDGRGAGVAHDLAGVLSFGEGSLATALSEAANVLAGADIEPSAWKIDKLPDHLRLRVCVVDQHGRELAAGRDVQELLTRLASRIQRSRTHAAKAKLGGETYTDWGFGTLADEPARAEDGTGYVALVDRIDGVQWSVVPSPEAAREHTARAVRRLFAIAVKDDLEHRVRALAAWEEMVRQYHTLGSATTLAQDLSCVIAERCFMSGQAPVRQRSEFESRVQANWGRLGTATIETGSIVSRTLAARFKVAGRLAGGTPRLWAASIADIREQAAYLMPRGFLLGVPPDRLRRYAEYAESMRQRLFNLREDGSGAETAQLAALAPYWKRFTGWVARRMNEEAAADREAGEASAHKPGTSKAALPQTRRTGQVVNADAGEWALVPGNVPAAVMALRWEIEETRLRLFAPGFTGKPGPIVAPLDALCKAADAS